MRVETISYLLNYLEETKNIAELLCAANTAGRTPLIEAVQQNNLIAARLFAEHGASYLQTDTKDSKNCLHLAVLKENELMVTEIINWAGTQNPPVLQELLNSVDYSGRTPCSLAATQDNIDILLKVSDEHVINLPDNKGRTPLYWSTYRQKPLNVKKIIEIGGKNLSSNEGNYPLHVACMSSNSKSYACLKLLRKFCGTTELRNNERHTALMIAAQRLNKKAFKYLVKKKANLFAQGKHGETIVHLLARTPQAAEFISYYLKNKQVRANDMLETPDHLGRTPLFYALDSANFASLVEEHRANITAVDFQLNTVLHVACQKKCPVELISYILDKAHDLIDWTNNDSETALLIATQLGQTLCMELLLSKAQAPAPLMLLAGARTNGRNQSRP